MKKKLSEMTLEELWQLFPIELVPHNAEWHLHAQDEIAALREIFKDIPVIINHIGSTAIPNIIAKPIIDLLVEIPEKVNKSMIINRMECAGYICMNKSERRLSFNKGYTPEGFAERVFHIHFHYLGDNAEITFRDYLQTHPERAREYELLKQSLLPKYRNDRDGYTAAKTEFVERILKESGRVSPNC